jgi:Protein of unknown function (DUF2489)
MQKPASVHNEEEWHNACHAVVTTAEAILVENLGIIEGARKLFHLRSKIKAEDDKDFVFFVGLDSETDHLPIGNVQKHWSQSALTSKKEEIESCENYYREQAFQACRNLIKKYKLQKDERA